MISES